MKTKYFVILAASLLSSAVPALANDLPPADATAPLIIKQGAYLRSADGRRIGVVDGLDTAVGGAPIAAQVIMDFRIVHIPVSTISGIDKNHFTTSLTYKAVEAL